MRVPCVVHTDVEETKSVCDLAIEESDLERENEATLATLERS